MRIETVLLCGANGQLGVELSRGAPAWAHIEATDVGSLDITNAQAVSEFVARTRPSIILNAAAYTAVDRAEEEPGRAFAANAAGPQNLARAAQASGAMLVQVSTDYVFDGALRRPYRPDDPVRPLGVYAQSKAEGEKLPCTRVLVIRTSWLYSVHGANFVNTMLRLMKERDELRVVADQVGAPTWAHGFARVLWLAAERGLTGIHHYSDAGETSWHAFAVAILEEARALGARLRAQRVVPITSAEFGSRVPRPPYSVLDSSGLIKALGIKPAPWRDNLRKMLAENPLLGL